MNAATDDATYMKLALSLAKQCKPSPNPQVGAVIVKDSHIIGQGYHKAPGMPHAEIEALRSATQSVKGATLYVTLEPCCHTGRTGPCTIALHEAGISRIVVGMKDPDPNVAGKGINYLEAKGHCVCVGVLEDACQKMLATYVQHRTLGRPQIHLKAAITLDGFLATSNGDSKWITGPKARAHGHQLRALHDGILVGIGTVLADNPLLTVRDAIGPNPTRIVLDTMARIPLDAKLLQTTDEAKVVIIHSTDAPSAKIRALKAQANVVLLSCASSNGLLDMHEVIDHLDALGCLSVLVEGGSKIHGAFVTAKLADRFSVFIAPKLIGNGISWAALPGAQLMANAIQAQTQNVVQLGNDTLIEGNFIYS